MTDNVLERNLCVMYGVSRPAMAEIRRSRLVQGEDWGYTPAPRKVFYTPAGVKKICDALEIRGEPLEAPAPAQNDWLPLEAIPKGNSNGLILTKGRPGWWTPQEAIVKANAFVNRGAILVNWKGRDVICRVRRSENFAVGMVIPVRQYGNILVAARHPRWLGKW